MYSNAKIKKAGKILISEEDNEDSLHCLSYWRSTHEKPLSKSFNIVEKESRKIDKNLLIAKRLKRTPSIINKLKRFNKNGMQLTTMQDIGGCRVIVKSTKKLYKIVDTLEKKGLFSVRNDYIRNPKLDGYRSVHLIGNFTASNINRNIELQVRTRTQHSWATAIEIVDIFARQNIKHNKGDHKWSDFFKHTSIVFSYLESCFEDIYEMLENNDNKVSSSAYKKLKKNFSDKLLSSLERIHYYSTTLNILEQFNAFAISINKSKESEVKDGYLLIKISNKKNKFTLSYKTYEKSRYKEAEEAYTSLEKVNKGSTIALIATSKIGDIQEAYPNYFADSTVFLAFMKLIIGIYEDIAKVKEKYCKLKVLSQKTNVIAPSLRVFRNI